MKRDDNVQKYCIFDPDKICDNCGECETCLLDANKKCTNCGEVKSLENFS